MTSKDNKETENFVAHSDWARVAADVVDLGVARRPSAEELHRNRFVKFYNLSTDLETLKKTETDPDLFLQYDQKYDLLDYVLAVIPNDDREFVQEMMDQFGLKFRFDLKFYDEVAHADKDIVNKAVELNTDEQAFIQVNNGKAEGSEVNSRVYNKSNSRSALNRTPIVRVQIVNENGCVVTEAYIKIRWIESLVVDQIHVISKHNVFIDCVQPYLLLGIQQMNEDIYNEITWNGRKSISKQEFTQYFDVRPRDFSGVAFVDERIKAEKEGYILATPEKWGVVEDLDTEEYVDTDPIYIKPGCLAEFWNVDKCKVRKTPKYVLEIFEKANPTRVYGTVEYIVTLRPEKVYVIKSDRYFKGEGNMVAINTQVPLESATDGRNDPEHLNNIAFNLSEAFGKTQEDGDRYFGLNRALNIFGESEYDYTRFLIDQHPFHFYSKEDIKVYNHLAMQQTIQSPAPVDLENDKFTQTVLRPNYHFEFDHDYYYDEHGTPKVKVEVVDNVYTGAKSEWTLKLSPDNKKLYAERAGGASNDLIATIKSSQNIDEQIASGDVFEYNKKGGINTIAKRFLNQNKQDLVFKVKLVVNSDCESCNDVDPILSAKFAVSKKVDPNFKDGRFDAIVNRPLNVDDFKSEGFTDAVNKGEKGSLIKNFTDVVALKDWRERAVNKQDKPVGAKKLWDYYQVADDHFGLDQFDTEKKLKEQVRFIEGSVTGERKHLTADMHIEYDPATRTLYYWNNNGGVKAYWLVVPVRVKHEWGYLYDEVIIPVNKTLGSK